MSQTEFLRGREVWIRIQKTVGKATRSRAAVAYLGRNGSELLPLKRGDTLVVDMSLGAVGQGVTDPKEVRKFMRRGVLVASRSDLHAKVVIADGLLFTGSMNASMNSANWLAEAAIVTSDRKAVAAARKTIDGWAAEPVLPLQLKEAIAAYRPPQFKAAKTIRRRRGRVPGSGPMLWIVGGLTYGDVPKEEEARAEQTEKAAMRGKRLRKGTTRSWMNFAQSGRFVRSVRGGDWVIAIVDGRAEAPARVKASASYPRGQGLRRYLVITEERDDVPTESFAAFRRAAKRSAGLSVTARTRLISGHEAEGLLNCWSPKTWRPLKKYFGS